VQRRSNEARRNFNARCLLDYTLHVRFGSEGMSALCLVYPRKRTFLHSRLASAKGQHRKRLTTRNAVFSAMELRDRP
jgi:hypothetical protein